MLFKKVHYLAFKNMPSKHTFSGNYIPETIIKSLKNNCPTNFPPTAQQHLSIYFIHNCSHKIHLKDRVREREKCTPFISFLACLHQHLISRGEKNSKIKKNLTDKLSELGASNNTSDFEQKCPTSDILFTGYIQVRETTIDVRNSG